MKASDLYKSVTEKIITELKQGVAPWAKPWKDGSKGLSTMPANATSGRPYSGINVLILYMEAMDKGYPTHGWATFQQANQIGASVRKGEKACQVVFVKRTSKEDETTGETKKSSIMRAYPVFNLAQLDNVPPQYLEAPPPVDEDIAHDSALQLIKDIGVKVQHGGNRAAYYPQRDEIVMPPFGQFKSEPDYWGTMFHETTHWTGNKKRLDRQFGKRFGDKAYSFEELVAELGAAFVCARLGIPATFRSSSYIDHWLKILGDDNRAIFTAASYAGHAADYTFEQAHAVQEHTPDVERPTPREKSEQEMDDSIAY
ncbi:ArdC family protein [Bradyrhizobium sp.]|uniref:ArdC family protein n=1 Tax=Bradyrhizobium sp. TaxID=376 RepID=UPI00273735B8|nr:zincin-like metallopeptidase domain-containing protein [Bradyrhizobium sp.]MDP3078699.1 zincin-like metallopeptidase domain-containing protein [Bradyrhizobium sp.]